MVDFSMALEVKNRFLPFCGKLVWFRYSTFRKFVTLAIIISEIPIIQT